MDGKFSISDLTSFENLVAPKVLKIVYWLGLIGIALACLASFVGAFGVMQYSFASGLGTMLVSIIALGFGALMWRVVIEMYLVIFGIYERLGDIKDGLKKDV
ncbi:MAG TPA: DUF4282 domain-containing protein [Croceibacterium sp.]|nr:DUF4282 domain-containing protein [Croceibacterium sp.]